MGFFSSEFRKDLSAADDRRQKERLSASDLFEIEFKTAGLIKLSGMGYGKDVSESGLKFATPTPLKKGENINARIVFTCDFPGQKKLALPMQVVRVYKPKGAQRYRVGVRFLDLEKHGLEAEAIRQLVWWLRTAEPFKENS